MKVSMIATVTVIATGNGMALNGLPNKFVGCFTKMPTRDKLREAVSYKADLSKVPELSLDNIFKVVDSIPGGELNEVNTSIFGMITVFTQEPLFIP